MVTASRMVAVATVRSLVGSTRPDAVVFVLTAAVTVSVDLIVAVGIGVGVAALFAVHALAGSSGVHREELPAPARPGDEQWPSSGWTEPCSSESPNGSSSA